MSEPISNAEPGACHKGGDLRVHGHLRSRLSPGEGGPARKVYTLTGSGERCLAGWYTTVRTRRAARRHERGPCGGGPMNVATVTVNVLALAALVWAVTKDRERTKQALRIALRSFVGMLPMVLTIIILIGVLLGFVTQDVIRRLLGEESGFLGILTSAVVGGIMFIPSLIAFPLAASLLEGGAAVGTVAGFIASLTMIGVVSLPVEVRELGVKMTALRNGLGFLFALAIAVVMGMVL